MRSSSAGLKAQPPLKATSDSQTIAAMPVELGGDSGKGRVWGVVGGIAAKE